MCETHRNRYSFIIFYMHYLKAIQDRGGVKMQKLTVCANFNAALCTPIYAPFYHIDQLHSLEIKIQ